MRFHGSSAELEARRRLAVQRVNESWKQKDAVQRVNESWKQKDVAAFLGVTPRAIRG